MQKDFNTQLECLQACCEVTMYEENTTTCNTFHLSASIKIQQLFLAILCWRIKHR